MFSDPDKLPLLEVKGLKKYFPIQKGFFRKNVGNVKAVDDVNFYVHESETLGLVGESGCGKSTTGRCINRLYEPTAGEVIFRSNIIAETEEIGTDILKAEPSKLKALRQEISMIFQDPINSLNPRMTVADIISEPLVIHGKVKASEAENIIADLLKRVGMLPDQMRRYPHEFSGGQRQRIGIARALSLRPRLVICDEPVSALDVSIQAQILNLLQDLKSEFLLSYIFIAHDLSVVQHISNRIAVMYVGKIVEIANVEELYSQPLHPYTEALMSAVPKADPEYKADRIIMQGDVADPSNPPNGCYFHPRCRYAKALCTQKSPDFYEHTPGHFVACHFAAELKLRGI